MPDDEHQNETPNYYAIIPATVRYCKDLAPQEKLLYAEITALTNKEGYCWATNNYFANLYGLSIRSISRQISNLTEHGFIHVDMIYFENSNQIKERRITLPESDVGRVRERESTPIDKYVYTPVDKKIDTPIDKIVQDNITSINTTRFNKKQQTPVVVRAPVKKSKRPKGTAPDVSCLAFIAELPDADKLAILQATGNDVPNIQNAYDIAGQQGGIDNLAGWIIHMVGKLQRGEITPPVKVKRQAVSRFVNFEQRKIDFGELEQLELEQLKATMGGEKDEQFVNCFEDI